MHLFGRFGILCQLERMAVEEGKRIQTTLIWATYNGVEEGDEHLTKEHLLDYFKKEGCQWAVLGREIAPDTGMIHIHALVKMKKLIRICAKKFATMWDIQKRNGDVWHPHVEAKKYSVKIIKDLIKYICVDEGCDEEPLAWNIDWKVYIGEKRDHKKLIGIDEIREKGIKQCVEENLIPLHQVKATIQGYQMIDLMEEPKYTKQTKGLWLWGDAGVGKSTFVKELAEEYGKGKMYRKGASRWWDGYAGETVVVMDDPSQRSMSMILDRVKCWADQSPSIVETKGGMMWARHKWLVITTNWNPEEMCNQEVVENEVVIDNNGYQHERAVKRIKFDEEGWEAIKRRFVILHIEKHESFGYIRFSKEMFPDKEWCEFRDIIPKFDDVSCWKDFIKKFPEITKKPINETFKAWNSYAKIWQEKHMKNDTEEPPSKKQPVCSIFSVMGSGYE